ncbi:antitoxin Xre/MbcA/ParS toxin-binding domain-containing protein [Halomonas sp. CSM-2]|uniref:antitoxin Xre/MbcA/ParS toxin-binding domain-containing protein n=1 Tax=Halomonas sp. CSM-2 TaxID=1975722 RepID=UPI000A281229
MIRENLAVCKLAVKVFGDKQSANDWLSRPNEALGGRAPIKLCRTESGAKQVCRVLRAIEWGGVA